MVPRRLGPTLVAALVAVGVVGHSEAAAPAETETAYELVDLGTAGDPSASAVGLNDEGVVVGCRSGDWRGSFPVRWASDGSVADLGDDAGCAVAVNAAGTVVGSVRRWASVSDFSWVVPVVWDAAGTPTLLELPQHPEALLISGAARDISDDGTVVGNTIWWLPDISGMWPRYQATRWVADIPEVETTGSFAAVNEEGTAGGYFSNWLSAHRTSDHPVRVAPDGAEELLDDGVDVVDPPPLPDLGHVTDLNDDGVAVGLVTSCGDTCGPSRPAWWEADGTFVELPLSPSGLNNDGRVIGEQSACHAVWWDLEVGVRALPGLGGDCTTAADINEGGVIVGSARDAVGSTHAVLWRPVEVPITTTTSTTTSATTSTTPPTTAPTTTPAAPPAPAAVPVAGAPRFTG